MRRLILSTICAFALGVNAFGQGTINFGNSSSTLVTLFNDWLGPVGPIPEGIPGQFRFQLFIAPAGTLNSTQFVPTNVQGTNVSTAGRFTGGNGLVVSGAPAGGTGAILVRGWSSNLGTDYAEAINNWNLGMLGYIGTSDIAPNFMWGGDPGTGIHPTSFAFGGTSGIQTGFFLFGIPEPSALALSSLGLVLLAMLRRRNDVSVS